MPFSPLGSSLRLLGRSTKPHKLRAAPNKHVEHKVLAAETPVEDFWPTTLTLMVLANKGSFPDPGPIPIPVSLAKVT